MSVLAGKTVLVTGASSGIGLEASVELAKLGARVVVVARDDAKVARTVETVIQRSGSSNVSGLPCDFSVQAQVRRLADAFKARHDRLDILVNNAGGVSDKRVLTADGLESTWAINHLGYFLLSNLLLDVLRKSAPARIVNVSSVSHYRGTIDLEDIGYEKGGYFILGAYARSKLGNVLFTRELARRLAGTGVTVNCLHPGTVATGIWTKAPRWSQPLLKVYEKVVMDTVEEGARPILHLATSPAVEGKSGLYFHNNCQERTPSKHALDDALARQVWELSAKQVGLPA